MGVEYGGVRVQGMCPNEFYLGTCTCIFFIKSSQGVWVWMWSMGVSGCKGCVHMNSIKVHVHVFFFKKIKPRGVGVGVEYGGCDPLF